MKTERLLSPDPFFGSGSDPFLGSDPEHLFGVGSESIVYSKVGSGKFQFGSVTLLERQAPEM